MEIIDDFLPLYNFKQIRNAILHASFIWYFNEGLVREGDGKYQFTHGIFNVRDGGITSPNYYPLFDYFQQKLGVKKLDRIKVNCNPKTFFHENGGYHVDLNPKDSYQHEKTAILYINTNNGWTHIKGYGKVKSLENRVVIFDSTLLHTGYTSTKENRRVVLNCNFL